MKKIKYRPRLIKYSFSIDQDQKTIEINGKTYYPIANAAWQSGTTEGWETHNCEKKRVFTTGKRNLWAWTRGENHGYKIFTRGKYRTRRIDKYLWNKHYDIFLQQNIGERLVYVIHKIQNEFNNHKGIRLTPKSIAIVEFNGGEFYGLKIEKIEHEQEMGQDALMDFREHIKDAFGELEMAPWRGRSWVWADFIVTSNVLKCSKTGEPVLVDIDYMHVKACI